MMTSRVWNNVTCNTYESITICHIDPDYINKHLIYSSFCVIRDQMKWIKFS